MSSIKAKQISVVPLRGGFGNQLFCWAYGTALMAEGQRVFFDCSPSLGRGYALSGLIPQAQLIRVGPRLRRLLMSTLVRPCPGLTVFREQQRRPPERQAARRGLTIHWGYWQSPEWFQPVAESVRSDLRSWLQFARPTPDKVCAIHVRRGDYVSDPGASQVMGTLPVRYYEEAMGLVRGSGINDFVVYSDDREWAAKNLVSGCKGIRMAPESTALDDFRSMASAAAIITANSSFSWWAAFMSAPDSTLIVSPKRWFADSTLDSSAVTPPEWRRI